MSIREKGYELLFHRNFNYFISTVSFIWRATFMKKLYLILALLFALSACTVGQKCTYTQEGTKISSYVWFTKEVPTDLSKNNCN
jgi:hypothetical protein